MCTEERRGNQRARTADILLPDGDIYKAPVPESVIQAADPAAKYPVTGNESHHHFSSSRNYSHFFLNTVV